MTKTEGRLIVIEFDLPVVGEMSSSIDAFTITVPTLPYGYGSAAVDETCTVIAVEHYMPAAQTVVLSSGSQQMLEFAHGELRLALVQTTIDEEIALGSASFSGTQYKYGRLMLLEAG